MNIDPSQPQPSSNAYSTSPVFLVLFSIIVILTPLFYVSFKLLKWYVHRREYVEMAGDVLEEYGL